MHSATAAATTLAAFLFTCTCVLCYTSVLHGVFWADACPFVPFHLSHQDSSSQGACSKFPEHLAFPELHQRLWSAPPRMQHICLDAASLIHPSRCRYYIMGGTRSTALGAGHRPGGGDAPSAGARGLVGPGGLIGFDPLLEESGLGAAPPPARQEEAQLPGQGLSQV